MLQSVLISLALAQSGPVIKDVKVGTGAKAANGDLLTMVYKGTFSNGKVFDENMDKPTFTFTLGAGEVIKGWDKGVLGMKVGGERKLVIPPTLGYGSRTNGPIPANSTLYFDIKLLRVDKPKEKPNLNVTIITPGKGKPAKDGDTVNVLYTGTFLNGVKFDSSYDHKDANGKPSLFPVTIGQHRVVPGFEQGLIGMKVGEKRKVVIPYQLAYGEQGAPPDIPGKTALVFTLERKS